MTPELAKQLKDAGFPQDLKPTWIEGEGVVSAETHSLIPTLEELIEACGEQFYNLRRAEDMIGNVQWVVCSSYLSSDITGSTPSEAVAKLWLALNKKTI